MRNTWSIPKLNQPLPLKKLNPKEYEKSDPPLVKFIKVEKSSNLQTTEKKHTESNFDQSKTSDADFLINESPTFKNKNVKFLVKKDAEPVLLPQPPELEEEI